MEISQFQVEGYERVARCRDEDSGLHALIAVHSTTLGPALGGMRMLPYESEDAALVDVLRLARGMTYKSAVAGTDLGGGKSVLIGDPAEDKSESLFQAMGRFIDSFGGKYITAEDMNIGIADLSHVRCETRWVTGLSREEGSSGNPSPLTAYGCLVGLRAVCEELYGAPDLASKHVLIQGVGAVGGRLAELLKEQGAKVSICDIREERVAELADEHGFTPVAHADHHRTECDIYAPCATGAGLNDQTIPELNCKAVAGCANNQLLEFRHADALSERGVLYAPDYVINAGGIINIAAELRPGGYEEADALDRIEGIYGNLKQVFELSRAEGISTRDAAERLAERRLETAREPA